MDDYDPHAAPPEYGAVMAYLGENPGLSYEAAKAHVLANVSAGSGLAPLPPMTYSLDTASHYDPADPHAVPPYYAQTMTYMASHPGLSYEQALGAVLVEAAGGGCPAVAVQEYRRRVAHAADRGFAIATY